MDCICKRDTWVGFLQMCTDNSGYLCIPRPDLYLYYRRCDHRQIGLSQQYLSLLVIRPLGGLVVGMCIEKLTLWLTQSSCSSGPHIHTDRGCRTLLMYNWVAFISLIKCCFEVRTSTTPMYSATSRFGLSFEPKSERQIC